MTVDRVGTGLVVVMGMALVWAGGACSDAFTAVPGPGGAGVGGDGTGGTGTGGTGNTGGTGISAGGTGAGGTGTGGTGVSAGGTGGQAGCSSGMADCDGNPAVCETNITNDMKHCGVCHHDCLGGLCSDSRCQPVLVAEPPGAPGTTGNGFLTLDDAYVYFTYNGASHDGGVAMAKKDGSAVMCIACGQGEPREIVTGPTHVFWTDVHIGEVRRAQLGYGPHETVCPGGVKSPIAVGTFRVFWSNVTTVMSATHDGTAVVQFSLAQPEVGWMTQDDDFVYWTTSADVLQQSKQSNAPTALANGQLAPRHVTVDDGYVYWAAGDNQSGHSVKRVPKGGGTVKTVASGEPVFAIAVDDTHVYATGMAANGTIWRAPKTGGSPEILVDNQSWPFDIAVDDQAVYWTYEENVQVMKLAK